MHALQNMIRERADNKHRGIYSACTASPIAIESVLEQALEDGRMACVEATANQVNQFGGYTGMQPRDFAALVHGLAKKVGLPAEHVILGGDHLGPLTWRGDEPEAALAKAEALVTAYADAGFDKIHIDTSMSLRGDQWAHKPDDELVAARAVRLVKAVEKATCGKKPPVYIIGSEVPIPGGAIAGEDSVSITEPEDFVRTVEIFRHAFEREGLTDAWERVVGVVVQPGVEFGDSHIFEYDRQKAKRLTQSLRGFSGMVFEGHSTDYQTTACLRQMVEDGIAILKVGPALTFAQRECMFSFARIEQELWREQSANFVGALEAAMLANPAHWEKHYAGDENELTMKRKFSFADRCRYYLTDPSVIAAYEAMCEHLTQSGIPLSLLSQYLPSQYRRVRERQLLCQPAELIKDYIKQTCIRLYTGAME